MLSDANDNIYHLESRLFKGPQRRVPLVYIRSIEQITKHSQIILSSTGIVVSILLPFSYHVKS